MKIHRSASGLTLLLASVVVSAEQASVVAPFPQAPLNGDNRAVALYGNSFTHYNDDINTRLHELTTSLLPDGKRYHFRSITISSGHLGWHLSGLEFQNSLRKWDVVVFQGNSTEPISRHAATRRYFTGSATKMAEIAHKAGERVVYLMTWPNRSRPENTQKLADAYLAIAQKTGGYVAPAGLAFSRSARIHPEIELYHSDGRHPSLAGTYLASCVLFATLYNRSPVGGSPPGESAMSRQTATALQQIAWETVQAFRRTAAGQN